MTNTKEALVEFLSEETINFNDRRIAVASRALQLLQAVEVAGDEFTFTASNWMTRRREGRSVERVIRSRKPVVDTIDGSSTNFTVRSMLIGASLEVQEKRHRMFQYKPDRLLSGFVYFKAFTGNDLADDRASRCVDSSLITVGLPDQYGQFHTLETDKRDINAFERLTDMACVGLDLPKLSLEEERRLIQGAVDLQLPN